MATVVTIAPNGTVTITVGEGCDAPPCPVYPTKAEFDLAIAQLQAEHEEAMQVLHDVVLKLDLIYSLVRVPTSLHVFVGEPYSEGT